MSVNITFRHIDGTEAIKAHTTEKIGKLQRFLRKPISAKVTLSLEKLQHSVDVSVSSGGERYEAHESSEDMYASIDKVIAKLERQIRETHGAVQSKRRGGPSVRDGETQ